MEVAPGIHRIGEEIVNAYLIEDRGQLTLVDAGLPGYWSDFLATLTSLGRAIEDVRAVVLTHGHGDHIGFAERLRRAGPRAHVHAQDVPLAKGEVPNRARAVGPYRFGPLTRFLWFTGRRGYQRTPSLSEVVPFDDGATLDVPGGPRAIHMPGHTPGSAALLFGGLDALLSGDSINTYAVTSGRSGPTLSPFNFDRAQALDSLRRLDGVEATHVLPGHGGPWHLGVRAAVEAIRASEVERTLRRG